MGAPGQGLAGDIRYALRQLRRSPGFTLTALLTIALGVGANTAIFTLAHAVLLRQLPVTRPSELYSIGDATDCCINGGMARNHVYSDFSVEGYQYLRDHLPEFSQLAAAPAGTAGPGLVRRAHTDESPRQLQSSYVSGNYFDTFGVQPALGRLLRPDDDRPGSSPVAVMSYTTWTDEYAADPSVVGASFLMGGHPVTVVGVAPRSFFGDRVRETTPAFYLPIATEPQIADAPFLVANHNLRWLYLIGRVRPGTDLHTLQAHIDENLRNYMATTRAYSKPDAARELPRVHARLVSAAGGFAQLQSQVGTGLKILLGIAAMVLLIACANIANLLLARGMRRRAETALRIALGAARRRILRQLLTESVLLALLGGAAGVALAYAASRAMLALAFPEAKAMPVSATPSLPVLLFTLALSVVTGVLFGLAPAWSASRSRPADAMRGLARGSSSRAALPQRILVVTQATLSLVLLMVAALLSRSLNNLERQDFGFRTDHRLSLHLDLSATNYKAQQLPLVVQQLESNIRAVPGTEAVATANFSPQEGNNWGESVMIEGKPDPALHQDTTSSWDRVTPGFFHVIGQPLLLGRDFAETDTEHTPLVAIVNQSFVRKFLPGEYPIGKRFGSEPHKFPFTIIGVVADAKYANITEATAPMFFRSTLQLDPAAGPKDMGELISGKPNAIVIQTRDVDGGYEEALRRAVRAVNPEISISDLRSMDAQVAGQLNQQRLLARLTTAFGVLALVLASVGLYGVTAYSVVQRGPEIGIRMALGADRARVLRMVLRGALAQALLGLVLGVPLALLAGRALKSQLFGIAGHDVTTLAAAAGVLAGCALIAGLLPARRAASIDPVVALRAE